MAGGGGAAAMGGGGTAAGGFQCLGFLRGSIVGSSRSGTLCMRPIAPHCVLCGGGGAAAVAVAAVTAAVAAAAVALVAARHSLGRLSGELLPAAALSTSQGLT